MLANSGVFGNVGTKIALAYCLSSDACIVVWLKFLGTHCSRSCGILLSSRFTPLVPTQADSYISGYCSLTDIPAATTAVAAVPEDPATLSIAVAAAIRYSYILGTTPNCSAITLTQTEFYGNKAIGGGGGAIFWDGPVEDLIVSCSDIEDAFGMLLHFVMMHAMMLLKRSSCMPVPCCSHYALKAIAS